MDTNNKGQFSKTNILFGPQYYYEDSCWYAISLYEPFLSCIRSTFTVPVCAFAAVAVLLLYSESFIQKQLRRGLTCFQIHRNFFNFSFCRWYLVLAQLCTLFGYLFPILALTTV